MPWMVPGWTNYSAVDSPGGLLLGGTNYGMTGVQASEPVQYSLGMHGCSCLVKIFLFSVFSSNVNSLLP